MVGADGVLELITNNHAWPLGAGTPHEAHDARSCIGVGALQKHTQPSTFIAHLTQYKTKEKNFDG